MNYFLPIHCGAPDYFNYLKYIGSLLLNTLKISINFFILRSINFLTCPLIYFTDKYFKLFDSLSISSQESGENNKNSIINNNILKYIRNN